jgi:hypothetical protein
VTIPKDLDPSEMQKVARLVAEQAGWDAAEVAQALAKAVAPHPDHTLQRDRTGRVLPDFKWRRETPRSLLGRFTRRLGAREQAEAAKQATAIRGQFERALGYPYGDLRAGRLGPDEAASRGRAAIGEYYERLVRAGMQAAGNPAVLLSARERVLIDRIVRDEGDFWQGFMEDIAAGRGRMDYDERFAAYVNAAREAYWLGWVVGDMRPGRRIRWVLGETDHCRSCLGMAQGGPYSPEAFLSAGVARGYLPQSGSLECKGIRCQCRLEDR